MTAYETAAVERWREGFVRRRMNGVCHAIETRTVERAVRLKLDLDGIISQDEDVSAKKFRRALRRFGRWLYKRRGKIHIGKNLYIQLVNVYGFIRAADSLDGVHVHSHGEGRFVFPDPEQVSFGEALFALNNVLDPIWEECISHEVDTEARPGWKRGRRRIGRALFISAYKSIPETAAGFDEWLHRLSYILDGRRNRRPRAKGKLTFALGTYQLKTRRAAAKKSDPRRMPEKPTRKNIYTIPRGDFFRFSAREMECTLLWTPEAAVRGPPRAQKTCGGGGHGARAPPAGRPPLGAQCARGGRGRQGVLDARHIS